MNKEGCKARVFSGWHSYHCSRKAVKDGHCKQHHPDSVKARREKSDKLYKEEFYSRSRMYAFGFIEVATEEDLKKLLEKTKKYSVMVA